MTGNQKIIAHLGPNLLCYTASSGIPAQGVPLMQAMANLDHSDLATFKIMRINYRPVNCLMLMR